MTLQDGQMRPRAGRTRRLTARAIDSVVLGVSLFIAASIHFLSIPGDPFFPRSDHETLTRSPFKWTLLAMAIAISLAVLLYELVSVTAAGRTIGKAMLGVCVISHSDGLKPLLSQAFVRWLVPSAAGTIGAVGSAVIFDATTALTDYLYADDRSVTVVLLGAFIPWTVAHMSSLWDPDGRGWPDKAAGTAVISA